MMSSQLSSEYFHQIFLDSQNTKCVVCTNPSKEWACTMNAVFLCLSCAAQYKHLGSNFCNIKSINLEEWTEREILILKVGGNQKFLEYMQLYNLNSIPFQNTLGTRAAVYYRDSLQNQVDGIKSPEPPTLEEGRVIVFLRNNQKEEIKKESTFKDKLSSAYDKTKRFTSYTFNKIGEKFKSEEFKEGVSNFGTKTKDVAVSGYNKTKAGFSYLYQGIKNKIKK